MRTTRPLTTIVAVVALMLIWAVPASADDDAIAHVTSSPDSAAAMEELSEAEQQAVRTEADRLTTTVASSADPDAAYAELTAEEQELVRLYVTPAEETVSETVEPTVIAGTAASTTSFQQTCWNASQTYEGTALFGNTLYTYTVQINYCENGSSVTSGQILDARGETSTPGWSYEGVIDQNDRLLSSVYAGLAQFSFRLGGVGDIGQIQNPTPCLQLEGRPNGQVSASGSCALPVG